MKAPYSWIKEFIDIDLHPEEIAEKLNETGLETTVYKFGSYIENIITVKIISVQKHPEKDKLWVCEATDGKNSYQVITGADNVREGQVVILAKEGAIIKGNLIKPVKFGSILSQGMFLSLEELSLEDNSEGIFLLGENTPIGEDASKLLGLGEDWIFEIEITPNRADALSIKGLAREIGAIFNLKRKEKKPSIEILNEISPQIEILSDKVNRYRGVIIKDITVKPSPLQIQLKLIKAGQSVINNVVDITNYILIQEGQPLHAFDLDKIQGKVIVRNAKNKEKFTALDGNEYELKETDIVIADEEKILALGGIIGGDNSKVENTTRNILLEGANFDPVSIRKTAKRLSIQTESSYRFERGVDIESLPLAQDKAVQLIIELGGGTAVGEKDIYKNRYEPKEVILREKTVYRILGEKISVKTASEYLNRLEIPSEAKEDKVISKIPAFRAYDLEREIDLVEEVGRLYGLNNLKEEFPAISTLNFEKPVWYEFENLTRQIFISNGLNEVLTYTFVGEEIYNILELKVPSIKVINYILKSQSIMRDNLTVSLIQTFQENIRHQNKDLAIFEVSSVFFDEFEEIRAGFLVSGKIIDGYSYTKFDTKFTTKQNWDFLKVKGLIYSYLRFLGFDKIDVDYVDFPYLNKYESASIYVEGKEVGYFGKIHPKKAELLRIPKNTYICELKLKPVSRTLEEIDNGNYIFNIYKNKKEKLFTPIPKFPSVKRDLAFEADESFEAGKLLKEIEKTCKFVKKVKLFDVYYLGNGKKSIAVSIEFNAEDRSLSDDEVNKLVEKLVNELSKTLNVKLRT
jgi:phenylalanyl-tRNA synthetase beta chain